MHRRGTVARRCSRGATQRRTRPTSRRLSPRRCPRARDDLAPPHPFQATIQSENKFWADKKKFGTEQSTDPPFPPPHARRAAILYSPAPLAEPPPHRVSLRAGRPAEEPLTLARGAESRGSAARDVVGLGLLLARRPGPPEFPRGHQGLTELQIFIVELSRCNGSNDVFSGLDKLSVYPILLYA